MLATMSPSILPPLALSSLFLQHNHIRSYDVSNLGIMMSRPFCRIDISYNKLNEKAITNEQNLTFGNIEPGGQGSVNFQHNSLKTFPEFIEKMELKNLSEVRRLWDYHMDIRNNPIRCDCILVPIMEMIRPLLNVVQAFKVFLDIPCFNPTQLRGRSIYNITKTGDWENMTCPLYVINDCPRGCKCFYKLSGKRVNFLREEKTVFVNCTGSGLNELPHVLPKGDEYSIDFSGNNISVVRPRNYLGFTVMLNLSQNRLHKIDSRCVKLMRKTSKIILTKNIGLVKIPRSLKHLNSCRIEFPEVYLVCTCDNIWIKDWLVKNHINSDKTVCNIDKFFCRTSTGIIPLIRFTAETLTCTRNNLYARSLLITSVTSIVVLIGTVWLLSYFRYEIMILLRKERLKLKQTPSYHEYDIFISFDEGREDIRKWVIKTFIPLLQSLGYSFYVPMISLPFGEIRTEETERVVQKCRSFLVVLSDDYLGKETIWTSFEFKLIWKLFYAKPTLNML
ncbi:hypothetical protein FSP39_003258 [Pinctada imbricata]|uniref:TIR domain-containing protein n=1 Tax=Pinctada imbricata TaxID=66713 RepID=A0AA88Y1V0_PINIB|nr:hypothetical protein FSP39_003258 [Pinctada imbricata]